VGVRIAAVFPGQGSHRAGVLGAWRGHAAFEVVDAVTAGVGRDVVGLSDDDTAGARTADAQPAIFAASLVAWEGLRLAGVPVGLVAGHSLGEYTAAVAAGVLDVTAGARVVAARGGAMGEACAAHPGTMAAVVKADPAAVEALVDAIDGVVMANDNAPGQVVVAGTVEGVAAVADRADELGARVIMLDVEGAFHSPAMAQAVPVVRAAVGTVVPADPAIPLVTGRSGEILADGRSIVDGLVDGILSPVRWRAVQTRLADEGVSDLVELGPGGVLAGLAKRGMPADVRIHRVATPGDLDAVLDVLASAGASIGSEVTT
jgi:[acyl-carrier-protein] S-malonyltransferase